MMDPSAPEHTALGWPTSVSETSEQPTSIEAETTGLGWPLRADGLTELQSDGS